MQKTESYKKVVQVTFIDTGTYHEEGIGRLHETLELMLPLLKLRWRIQQIDIVLENLISHGRNERNWKSARTLQHRDQAQHASKAPAPSRGQSDEDRQHSISIYVRSSIKRTEKQNPKTLLASTHDLWKPETEYRKLFAQLNVRPNTRGAVITKTRDDSIETREQQRRRRSNRERDGGKTRKLKRKVRALPSWNKLVGVGGGGAGGAETVGKTLAMLSRRSKEDKEQAGGVLI